MYIPKYLRDLIDEYTIIYKQRPRGFNYDEWNSFEEYGEFLSKEIRKEPFRKRLNHILVNKKSIFLKDAEVYPINEQIAFYEENISILKYLLDKLDYAIKEYEYTSKKTELNIRQNRCLRRIMDIFVVKDDKNYYTKFSEAFYELTDFIYYPNFEYDKLSLHEIEIIKMMANYLINKAYDRIYELNGDEYKGEFKLQKRYSSISKIYFNLIYKDKIIGKGWIRKKFSYIKKGMYLYIEPDYRGKGYGTIFYNLLAIEMSERDIPFIILKVNKYDKKAINFLDKQIDKNEKRYKIFNKKIFIDVLIIDG